MRARVGLGRGVQELFSHALGRGTLLEQHAGRRAMGLRALQRRHGGPDGRSDERVLEGQRRPGSQQLVVGEGVGGARGLEHAEPGQLGDLVNGGAVAEHGERVHDLAAGGYKAASRRVIQRSPA